MNFFFKVVPTRFKRRNCSERIALASQTTKQNRKHRKQFAAQDQGRHTWKRRKNQAQRP